MDANNILQKLKFSTISLNEEDKTTRLNRIEKYISKEFTKQLNKYWRFFMDANHPLNTMKVSYVQILNNHGFLKIRKIHNSLDYTLIKADQTEGIKIVCFRLLSLNPHDCAPNLCVCWKKHKDTYVRKDKCNNFDCEGIISDEVGDLFFYNKNHEEKNYEIKTNFFEFKENYDDWK